MELHITRSQHQQLPTERRVFQVTYRFMATEEEQALSRKYPLDQIIVFGATGMATSQLPLVAEFTEQYMTPAEAEQAETSRMVACDNIASYLKDASAFGGEEDYTFSCDPSKH